MRSVSLKDNLEYILLHNCMSSNDSYELITFLQQNPHYCVSSKTDNLASFSDLVVIFLSIQDIQYSVLHPDIWLGLQYYHKEYHLLEITFAHQFDILQTNP